MPTTKTKATTGISGGAIVALLVFAALASSGKPLTIGQGGGGGGYPYHNRVLAEDPCPREPEAGTHQLAHAPWERVIRQQKVGAEGTRAHEFSLFCDRWRRIVDDVTFYMQRDEFPSAEDLLKCIGNVIGNGSISHYTARGVLYRTFTLSANQVKGAHVWVTANDLGEVTHAGFRETTVSECAG